LANKTIAFHSLFAQNALRQIQPRLGGAEKRSVLLCRMLAESGYSTALLMADPGKNKRISKPPFGIKTIYHPKYKLKEGIQVDKPTFKSNIWHKAEDKLRKILGIPLRNVPELAQKKAFAPFFKAQANLWIGLSLNDAMLELAQFCQTTNTPFLLGIAHDIDLDFLQKETGRDIFGACREKKRRTMDLVSAVLVQNLFQQRILKQAFPSLPVYYLPNPIEIANPSEPEKRGGVAWIGKMDANKNPMALVRLARKLPEIRFKMLANPADDSLESEVLFKLPPNVERIQNLPYDAIPDFLAQAQVHLSTSLLEGFPNTFLEAAIARTPTVSLNVDPDGLIEQGHFGFCAGGDESILVELVLKAMNRGQEVQTILDKSLEYVEANHSYPRVKQRWLQIIATLTD
jgi:glycosyltransferase involved in cell wall biosynthesis